jgi:twitching motility protein PilT
MRDAETIDTAMKAAETGHLLISTVHTPDAVTTVMRIVSMFPPEEQLVVRMRLAESLHAVVSQRLLPRKSGQGRVVAVEVMIVTSTIRDLIIEGRMPEIRDYIADGEQYGMQTFDQHLTELVQNDEIDYETAKGAATNPADFELVFRMGRNRQTPASVQGMPFNRSGRNTLPRGGQAVGPLGGNPPALQPLGINPLGTGATLPPIAPTPSSQESVSSPSPLGKDIFGSGFESLFGQ